VAGKRTCAAHSKAAPAKKVTKRKTTKKKSAKRKTPVKKASVKKPRKKTYGSARAAGREKKPVEHTMVTPKTQRRRRRQKAGLAPEAPRRMSRSAVRRITGKRAASSGRRYFRGRRRLPKLEEPTPVKTSPGPYAHTKLTSPPKGPAKPFVMKGPKGQTWSPGQPKPKWVVRMLKDM